MTGRGWIKKRLAEKREQEESNLLNNAASAPIPVGSGFNLPENGSKTPVFGEGSNGIHKQNGGVHVQENGSKTPVSGEGSNGIHKQNGVHVQENGFKSPVFGKGNNGIYIQNEGASSGPVCNLTNGVQLPVMRGRQITSAISDLIAAERSKLNISELGLSSLVIDSSKPVSAPFPRAQKNNAETPKMPVPVTQNQTQSMVSAQHQFVEIECEEAPHVEHRVSSKPDQNRYQIKPFTSNHLRIEVDKNKGVYEYSVSFMPEIDSTQARNFLINQHREMFPIKIFCGLMFYVPQMLPEKITVLRSKFSDQSEVTIKIAFVRKVSLNGSIYFYNVVIHSILKLMNFVQFNKSCFNPSQKICLINEGLEIWPGFVTTIDEYDGGLLMCCDVSHRILRLQTVLQFMSNIARNEAQSGKIQEILLAHLTNVNVITRYNNKTYSIDDIDFESSPVSVFQRNGNMMSYADYYRNMYDIQIRDLKQPMLISKIKKKDNNKPGQESTVYLVPELCNFTGLTDAMKSNFQLMKTLQTYTLVAPNERQKALVGFVQSIYAREDCREKLNNWGITIKHVPVQLEGPVYKKEFITLANEQKTQVGPTMEWTRDVMNNKLLATVNLSNWAIVYCGNDHYTVNSFCRQLSICAQQMGMTVNQPLDVPVNDSHLIPIATHNVIQNRQGLQLVVILFSCIRNDMYNHVKKICCAQLGIPSQVVLSKSISRPDKLRSVTQKIALQINCKLGGAGWGVNIPLLNTMIIGIDVYHEKNKRSSSVLGFVASVNNNFTKFYSTAVIQQNTQNEITDNFYVAIYKALDKYKELNNGTLPEKIIVYRDGISFGDIKTVKETEVKHLYDTVESYSTDYRPKVTFITVQKRINTRIFQYLDNAYQNPCAGTVVDNTVTRRNVFDFFLVAQNTRQGSVSPAHYIVLKNDCGLSVERVQLLSYKLCHLYYNWCGTIKVPAPLQYAHKLAYLIGENVRQLPNEKLCDTLFYL